MDEKNSSKIITYKNDCEHCYSQIEFNNKERILISIGSNEVMVFKLLFNVIPTKEIYKSKIHSDDKIAEIIKFDRLVYKKDPLLDFVYREGVLLDALVKLATESNSSDELLNKINTSKKLYLDLSGLIDAAINFLDKKLVENKP